jgi:dihydroxy-acid dehydratase
VVGHVSPEAALGGPIALVKNGDEITIDAERREITLHVAAAELKRRRKAWGRRKPYARRGALAKYAKQVSSASLGAVTDRSSAGVRSDRNERRSARKPACSAGGICVRLFTCRRD